MSEKKLSAVGTKVKTNSTIKIQAARSMSVRIAQIKHLHVSHVKSL